MTDWEAVLDRVFLVMQRPGHGLEGCSEAEIAALEAQAGQRLPAAYREFLARVGKEAGGLFAGTDMFYRHLPKLRGWGEELLRSAGLKLPDDAFVFSMHQGYELMFFRLSEGDDPPVYQYVEGKPAWTRPWPSFSAFLEDALRAHTWVDAEHSEA